MQKASLPALQTKHILREIFGMEVITTRGQIEADEAVAKMAHEMQDVIGILAQDSVSKFIFLH